MRYQLYAALALCFASAEAAEIFPLDAVRPGQQGVGRTVFSGDAIEEFEVEILGVLENIGPKQSLILARLSGGPLERTGVMAGMSGSPVYLEGKLAGAVAFSFPFSTEPLCGIRPIGDMLAPSGGPQFVAAAQGSQDLAALLAGEQSLAPPNLAPAAPSGLSAIAAPTAFAGFSAAALETFGPALRKLGLAPLQGVGGRARFESDDPLEAGSMISVALVRGDLSVSAAGTVTLVEDDRLYAFGHTFLSTGPTSLPMMRSAVLTLVPNLANSFKLAGDGPVIGAIQLDRSTGVIGTLGASPRMVPTRIEIQAQAEELAYDLELAQDPFLTPFLLQLTAFSALDANVRGIGPLFLRVEGSAEFEEAAPPLRLGDVFSGSASVGLQAALGAASRLAFVLQSAGGALTVRKTNLRLTTVPRDRRFHLVRAWAEPAEARPGEAVSIRTLLRGPGGEEVSRRVEYRVPEHMSATRLQCSVADAQRVNALDFPLLLAAGGLAPAQLVQAVNGLRPSDRLYVRVAAPGKTFRVQSQRLSDAPASLRAVLDAPAGAAAGAAAERQNALAELASEPFDGVVDGFASFTLTVRP